MKKELITILLFTSLIGISCINAQDSHLEKIKNRKVLNKTVSNNRIGDIAIGDSLKKAFRLLKENYYVMYDSSEMCVGCFDEFEYIYRVSSNGTDTIFLIHPGQNEETLGIIYSMVLYDSTFVTDRGIKIGDSVKDLKEKYNIYKAYFNYEDGLYLFAEDWEGSFGIIFETGKDYAEFNFEAPKPEDIPECLKIRVIGIF